MRGLLGHLLGVNMELLVGIRQFSFLEVLGALRVLVGRLVVQVLRRFIIFYDGVVGQNWH